MRLRIAEIIRRELERLGMEVNFRPMQFNTLISKSVRLEESPAYHESIFSFAPHSSGAAEYYQLSEEVLGRGV